MFPLPARLRGIALVVVAAVGAAGCIEAARYRSADIGTAGDALPAGDIADAKLDDAAGAPRDIADAAADAVPDAGLQDGRDARGDVAVRPDSAFDAPPDTTRDAVDARAGDTAQHADRGPYAELPGEAGDAPELGQDSDRAADLDAHESRDAEALGDAGSGLTCGTTACPRLGAAYRVLCNGYGFCEYGRPNPVAWQHYDVWIWVPPGGFPMGRPAAEAGETDEVPQHPVTFARGFFVAKYEAVVMVYEACELAGACDPPSTAHWDGAGWGTNRSTNDRANHPQNGLTWQQAETFCRWLGGGLPTEAQWEYAAKGPQHRKYPWGDTPEPTCANRTAIFNEGGDTPYYGCGAGGTQPAGAQTGGFSWCGALDMAGNLWEWVQDYHHGTYANAPSDGSAWLDGPGNRVTRGGGFDYGAAHLRSANRSADTALSQRANLGVRCFREPSD